MDATSPAFSDSAEGGILPGFLGFHYLDYEESTTAMLIIQISHILYHNEAYCVCDRERGMDITSHSI